MSICHDIYDLSILLSWTCIDQSQLIQIASVSSWKEKVSMSLGRFTQLWVGNLGNLESIDDCDNAFAMSYSPRLYDFLK